MEKMQIFRYRIIEEQNPNLKNISYGTEVGSKENIQVHTKAGLHFIQYEYNHVSYLLSHIYTVGDLFSEKSNLKNSFVSANDSSETRSLKKSIPEPCK